MTTQLPPSLIEQAIWIVRELGIEPDMPTSALAKNVCTPVPDMLFSTMYARGR